MPDGTPILVMEHLEGRTLEEMLANRGAIALPEVVPTIKAIASALEAAHKVGVVHREVRPDNIFVADVTGYEQGFPKLLDFGGLAPATPDLAPAAILATAAARYLSPEQARGHAAEVDARTDQYALAALAYRMLSGTDAFGGNDVISVLYRILNEAPRPLTALARVDTTIDPIIRKAMSRDKRLRFDSVFVFAKALEDAAGMGSRMVRNPLLAMPTPSPVRFVPSTAPAPVPERPVLDLAAAAGTFGALGAPGLVGAAAGAAARSGTFGGTFGGADVFVGSLVGPAVRAAPGQRAGVVLVGSVVGPAVRATFVRGKGERRQHVVVR